MNLILAVIILLASSHAFAETHLLIKTRAPIQGASLLRGQSAWKKLIIRDSEKSATLQRLKRDRNVEWVEEDHRYHVDAIATNDPYSAEQWSLVKSQITEAWALVSANAPEILVAVIDTGVDQQHPDLASQIFTNTKEIAGNGIDDDKNGFIDDVHGFNFEEKSANTQDDFNHGTHVSGIIGAMINNHIGIAGIAPKIKILPVKWMKQGSGWGADAIEAIHYAVKMGARVINASWGGIGYSKALEDAVRDAEAHGVLFVASAGNNGTDNDVQARHPANLRLSNVISVAYLAENDQLGKKSNYGLKQVEIGAPGDAVVSTVMNHQYAKMSGTSMAAAHVSGVAALLLSINPKLNAQELKHLILETVTPVPALRGKTVTGGRINALAAAKRALQLRLRPKPFAEFAPDRPIDDRDLSGRHPIPKALAGNLIHADHVEDAGTMNGLSLQFIRRVKGRDIPIEGLAFKAQLQSGSSTAYKTYASNANGVIEDGVCGKSQFTVLIPLESRRYSVTSGNAPYEFSLTARCNVKQKIVFDEKTENAQPIAIWQVAVAAEKKLNAEIGLKSWTRPIQFVWPANGDFYADDVVHLTLGYQWDVVSHEMGHAIYDQGRIGVFGGGEHYIDRCYGESIALSEGWASFYASWLNLALNDPDAKFEYMVPRRAPIRIENIPDDVCGKSTNEWRVNGFLWDLIDTHVDQSARVNAKEVKDSVAQPFAKLWVDTVGARATSVKAMKDHLIQKGWSADPLNQLWKLNFPAE